jgi:hypothetical protein
LQAIAELISTEEDYLRDLGVIERVWGPELRKSGAVSADEWSMLFSKIPELIVVAQTTLTELKKNHTRGTLAPAIRSLIPTLKLLVLHFVDANEVLESPKKNTKLAEAAKQIIEANPAELRGLSLAAFMIKPTQRSMKYPLFLRDIVEHTEHDHPEYGELQKVTEELKIALALINKEKQERETELIIKRLGDIEWRENAVDWVASKSRILVYNDADAELVARDHDTPPRANALYLFNNVLLALKVRKDHRVSEALTIEMGEDVFVREQKAEVEGQEVITIVHKKTGQAVTFHLTHPGQRRLWLNAFEEVKKPDLPKVVFVPAVKSAEQIAREDRQKIKQQKKESGGGAGKRKGIFATIRGGLTASPASPEVAATAASPTLNPAPAPGPASPVTVRASTTVISPAPIVAPKEVAIYCRTASHAVIEEPPADVPEVRKSGRAARLQRTTRKASIAEMDSGDGPSQPKMQLVTIGQSSSLCDAPKQPASPSMKSVPIAVRARSSSAGEATAIQPDVELAKKKSTVFVVAKPPSSSDAEVPIRVVSRRMSDGKKPEDASE